MSSVLPHADAPHRASTSPPKVTLVIGSGSVKCAAGLGVAKALYDAGIDIERVVGCSAGAIFGSLVAMKIPLEQAIFDAKTLWTKEITGRKNRMTWLRMLAPKLLGFDVSHFALRDETHMRALLKNYFGPYRIEQLPIPMHITATDFLNGELVELDQGPLDESIRASIAIPFAFAPVSLNGQLLMDGYLSDPLPISVAMRNGAQVIVAVGFESPTQEIINSPGRFAFQMMAIMSNNLLKARYAFHNAVHHAELITIVPEFTQRIRLFDTEKIPYIVEEGERATQEQLPYLKQVLGLSAG
jgi:NTE family protein